MAALHFVSAGAALLAAASTSALVPVGGYFNRTAQVELGDAVGFDHYDEEWLGAPPTISADIAIAAVDPETGNFVAASGRLTTESVDVHAGRLVYDDFGVSSSARLEDYVLYANDGFWSYRFTAEHDVLFTLEWDFTATGDPLRFVYASAGSSLDGQGRQVQLFGDGAEGGGSLAGSFSQRLAAGQTYSIFAAVQIFNSGQFIAPFAGALDGTIGWTLAEVPEPASWALFIAGFGLVGATMRGRRADVPITHRSVPAFKRVIK